jgi:hypothetical protein
MIRTACFIFACFAALSAHAYKEPVHSLITRHAFERLNVDFKTRLGVTKTHSTNGQSLRARMERGAFDADKLPNPVNHFLDPEHNAALTTRVPYGVCALNGVRADQWARNRPSTYALPWLPHTYRNAILGPNAGTRDASLAELFTSFGHIIHLVQDMAQPEHTRNDQHLPLPNFVLQNGYEASVWEVWGAANLVETINPVTKEPEPPVVSFEGYPTVRLPDYGSYFQTPEYPTLERKGLANFSNRNFVTQDTNYSDESPCGFDLPRCYKYSYPSIDDPGTSVRIEPVGQVVFDDFGNQVIKTVDEAVYSSTVYDAYTGSTETDWYHNFHSLLDMETGKYGCPVYSLSDASYFSRASMLIPRAVGYTAGFIEHFFRGRIDVAWKPANDGTWDMTLTNRSDEAIGADATVEAVYLAEPSYFGGDSSDDIGFIINSGLAAAAPGFSGLSSGESVTIHGVQPLGLKPGDALTKFERRVVVRGTLGFSENEVIGLIQPPSQGPKLRAVISWPESYRGNMWITNGFYYEMIPEHQGAVDECDPAIPVYSWPRVCYEIPGPPDNRPITVTFEDPAPDMTFTFLLGADCCRSPTFTMTTTFYLDDQLVKTETSTVTVRRNLDIPFASYP